MFTKEDLKNGDFVEYRNGSIRVVADNYLIGKDHYGSLNCYSDDLLYNFPRIITGERIPDELDIMKVYREVHDFSSAKTGEIVYDKKKCCRRNDS